MGQPWSTHLEKTWIQEVHGLMCWARWAAHHQGCDSDLRSLLPLVIGQFIPHVIHIPANKQSRKSMGNLWEIYGKSMGNLWEIYGKSMGNLWEIYGTMVNVPFFSGFVEHHQSKYLLNMISPLVGWCDIQLGHQSQPLGKPSEAFNKKPDPILWNYGWWIIQISKKWGT